MTPEIRLGVNIDHVATLRQLRAPSVNYPDIKAARDLCVRGGADQITIHLRGDRRHIQERDLVDLAREKGGVLLNLEMAPTREMTELAVRTKPDIVCLVPEKREELTTEGGLDVIKNRIQIGGCIAQCKKNKIRVSLFIEASQEQIEGSKILGADAVEFHTGQYALAKGADQKKILDHLFKAAALANEAKLKVHAGHGLDYTNVIPLLKMPHLEELNIGHSIICKAVFSGLLESVKEMKTLISKNSPRGIFQK
jgi:pyridoxine 5-phosphate synthase